MCDKQQIDWYDDEDTRLYVIIILRWYIHLCVFWADTNLFVRAMYYIIYT